MNEALIAFGERLRAARTDLDLTLEEVEKATRIRKRFLEGFENGTPDTTLSQPQTHGFLRNYAKILKLDPDEVVGDYEQAKRASANQGLLRMPFRRTDLNPDTEPVRESTVPVMAPAIAGTQIPEDSSTSRQIVRVFLYLVLTLVFVGMVGVGVLMLLDQRAKQNDPNQAANPDLLTDPAQQQSTEFPTQTPTPSPTPSATQGGVVLPPPIPNTGQGLAVFISATARSWVQVTVDGVIQYSGILRPGTALQYQANESVALLTGNAGGLDVMINGTSLGSLGAMGTRYQDTFTISDLETPSSFEPLIPPSSTAFQIDTETAPENGADLFLPTSESATAEPDNPDSPLVTQAPTPIAPPPTIGPATPTPTITLTPSITPTLTPDLPDRATRTPRPG